MASPADECPAGSTLKNEEGFTWCQPSVCKDDANCSPSEVCRPIPLCVQVGKLDKKQDAKDAAERLVATQRCAQDDTCPDTTTCSKMSRCIGKAAADKMGLLSAPGASASAAPAETKKSSCGCVVAGGHGIDPVAVTLAGLVLLAIGSRKIHRRRF